MTYSIKSYLIFVGSVLLTYLYLCFDVNYILNIPDYLRLLFVDAEIIEKYGQYLNYIMAISMILLIEVSFSNIITDYKNKTLSYYMFIQTRMKKSHFVIYFIREILIKAGLLFILTALIIILGSFISFYQVDIMLSLCIVFRFMLFSLWLAMINTFIFLLTNSDFSMLFQYLIFTILLVLDVLTQTHWIATRGNIHEELIYSMILLLLTICSCFVFFLKYKRKGDLF